MATFISAASDVSAYVIQIDSYARSRYVGNGSAAQGEDRRDALKKLQDIVGECSRPGWDGDNAVPISEPLQKVARTLIQSLPPNLEDPDLGAESDGSITFEWRNSASKVISISVSPDSNLYFAALVDGVRKRAAYPSAASSSQAALPKDLLRVINDVVGV